ncbi:iron chaperone [Vagococcus sp.]|uniref:iron chaperone n=1 Tax=Vagococcus sp. TaxID=1933889 RepID=UPI003F949613
MSFFNNYLDTLTDSLQKEKMETLLQWISLNFPQLEPRIAWKQPMFTHHETYIIGFSVAKKHLAIAPEKKTILLFEEQIKNYHFSYTQQLIRVPLTSELPFELLTELIDYNLEDKKECQTFWRP